MENQMNTFSLKAMQWWNNELTEEERYTYSYSHYSLNPKYLRNESVQIIYEREMKQLNSITPDSIEEEI